MSNPDETLAGLLASALWNNSTLRHGMFTPPQFRKICERVIAEELNKFQDETSMEDRWDYDHGPDHIREVMEG